MKKTSTTIWLVLVLLVATGDTRLDGGGDFILYDNEQLTVNADWRDGSLFDTSRVFIVPGGYVYTLHSYNYSTTNISGGDVGLLFAFNSSTANMSGGSIGDLITRGDSTANLSGGGGNRIFAEGSSTVNISGGKFTSLDSSYSSTTTFYGRNFHYGSGLTLDGTRVLGTGILSGEWLDRTQWAVNICSNLSGATILAVPEPATLLLLGFGGLMLRRKR